MKNEDLRPYRKLGLTLLQLMLIVGLIGIALTIVLQWLA